MASIQAPPEYASETCLFSLSCPRIPVSFAMEWSGRRCTANHTPRKMSKMFLAISVWATPRIFHSQLTFLVSSVALFVIAGWVILSLLNNLRLLGNISHQQKRSLYVNGLCTRVRLVNHSIGIHSYIESQSFLAGSHPNAGIDDSLIDTQIYVLGNPLVLIPNKLSASIAPG